jgi:hypothetical protein
MRLHRLSRELSSVELAKTRYAVTNAEQTVLDPTWDSLVESTAGGDLVQTTLWAASRQRLGFRAFRISLTDSDQTLVGGGLMYTKRLAPGLWLGSIPRGPLTFVDRPGVAPAMLRRFVVLSRQCGVRLLVIQPPPGATALEEAVTAGGFVQEFRVSRPSRPCISISVGAMKSFSGL